MAMVLPFRVVRPRDDLAGDVIAPPYDVLSDSAARTLARNRHCFVRVTRSEVDLPEGTDPHSDEAYAMARQNLDAMLDAGDLVQDDRPGLVVYGQKMGDHEQVGLIAAASVDEYDQGLIAKHEYTRPDKEDDRTHHTEVLDAQVGLVFLTYRSTDTIDGLVAQVTARAPRWRVTTEDDVVHTLWSVPDALLEPIQEAFADVPKLYVADGHHRSAAASRVHANRGDRLSATFMAGLYPDDQLAVMAYNRVVDDLVGRDVPTFLEAVSERWSVEPASDGEPTEPGDIRMYCDGRWYRIQLDDTYRQAGDPVARLDVAELQTHLLEPLLDIDDPRRSSRIRFIGGIHGSKALTRAVDEGAGVAFHLFPTRLSDLFDVADADRVMPPKSTWFEPKLREGVALRLLR